MLSLYLGAVEISQGIGADRKVTLTARTVADLVSQVTSVSNSDMTNSLNAASTVMAPFPSGNLKVVVSSVKIDGQGNATISWSDTLNGTARAKGASVTLPAALNVPNSSLIWSEVQYNYTPVIGYIVTGSMNLKDQIYMRPRMSDCVLREAVQTTCS
jgi:Flp pilus assembly protein TadG